MQIQVVRTAKPSSLDASWKRKDVTICRQRPTSLRFGMLRSDVFVQERNLVAKRKTPFKIHPFPIPKTQTVQHVRSENVCAVLYTL
jgi:hypothetical protein